MLKLEIYVWFKSSNLAFREGLLLDICVCMFLSIRIVIRSQQKKKKGII